MTDSVDPGNLPGESQSEAGQSPAPGRGLIIGLAVAVAALAAVVLFLLLGDDGETPATTAPETTVTSPPTSAPATTGPTQTSAPATTAPASTSVPETTATSAPPTSTTEVTADTETVPVFFLHDSGGRLDRPGPFLAPAARPAETLEEALTGVLVQTSDEIELGLTTAVPEDATLNGVDVEDGVALVDVSSTFEEGGGTFSMQARLAQLVFTATAFDPDITGVRLLLDGTPVEVFSGEGLVLDDPMTRASFQDVTPGILVETPAFGGVTGAPVTVTGIAAAFEGVFQMEILDSSGTVVADVPFVQTDNGTGWGNFTVTFSAGDLPEPPAELQVRVWEFSAEDGSVISERIQPFSYVGGD